MNAIEKYLPAPQVLLAFAASFVVMAVLGAPVYTDQDVLWHIAAGDLIRQMGELPTRDPWSFTAGEQPWYLISWLFDIVLSFVHEWGGIKAVYLFPMLVLSALVAVLVRGMLKRDGISSDAIIMLSICAMLAFMPFSTSRPHIVAFLLAAIMHQILHASRDSGRFAALLWLPPMMAVWVNVHGSFVVGLSLLGAYGLEAIIYKKWDWFKRLFTVSAVCALALLCNPYGFDMITGMNRTLDSSITKYIQEWLPFVFSNYMGLSAWVLLFIVAGSFRENAIPVADKIISIIWFVFMLFSMRHAATFVVVSSAYLAISLQKSIDYLDSVMTPHPDPLAGLQRSGMRAALACIGALALAGTYLGLELVRGDEYRVVKENDITPAIAYLEQHHPGKRFLNDYALGGQQIYLTRGRAPLFVDGRAGTAYPEEVLEDYMDFLFMEKEWSELTEKYRIDGIIVLNSHRFASAYEAGQYRDEWKEVFRDEVASVYIRR